MRIRERGIGNLPFIAVLVLLVIAIALFFMARSEADDFKNQRDTFREQAQASDGKLQKAREAYDAWVAVSGLSDTALNRNQDTYPSGDTITDKVRSYLDSVVKTLQTESEAKVKARVYRINADTKEVTVIPGDPTVVRLYGSALVKDTMTFQGVLAPMPAQFKAAAKMVTEMNDLYEKEYDSYRKRTSDLDSKYNAMQSKYDQDVSAKGQQADGFRNELENIRDQNTQLVAANDNLQTQAANTRAEFEKKERVLAREANAWKNRAIAEKEVKELALAEDPKDGEVLVAEPRRGLVFINRGRQHQVSAGTKFTVWRAGKGNVRENVAEVRVIRVERTRSTCRVLKTYNPRVPVAKGMNISNPFYDPFKKLRVYVYGDLRKYPTDVAKRRLAESGVIVQDQLDDRVNVIVLGEPPVTASDEEPDDEAGAALLARRMTMERDRNLQNIRDVARSIGALVVTEDVLSTFVDY